MPRSLILFLVCASSLLSACTHTRLGEGATVEDLPSPANYDERMVPADIAVEEAYAFAVPIANDSLPGWTGLADVATGWGSTVEDTLYEGLDLRTGLADGWLFDFIDTDRTRVFTVYVRRATSGGLRNDSYFSTNTAWVKGYFSFDVKRATSAQLARALRGDTALAGFLRRNPNHRAVSITMTQDDEPGPPFEEFAGRISWVLRVASLESDSFCTCAILIGNGMVQCQTTEKPDRD